ncbi:MAG: DUF3108 domain-containing protein [Halofilum sp. (in: g-proteobacteria)]
MWRHSAAALACWLMATAAFGSPATLPGPLTPFEARYEVSNGTLRVGTASFKLTHSAGLWRYRSTLEARGLFALFAENPMRETTWLQPHEGELRPMIYRHQEGEEVRRVVFDWSAGQAQVQEDGERRRIPLEPASRDQLSAILAVMVALEAGEHSVTFPGVTDDGESAPLHFERAGTESLTVAHGTYDTVRVDRQHDDDRVTSTWLAPALAWLPVRVEQREDGELIARLNLTELTRETTN